MIYNEKPDNFSPRYEVVGCFLEDPEGKFLVLHIEDHKPQGNTWGIPSGKIEDKETALESILRELKEETGYEADPEKIKYLKGLYVRYDEYDFIYHIFSLKLEQKPEVILEKNGHKDFKWVTRDECLKLNYIQDLDECITLYYGTK